jgi:hypothetical protein
MHFGTSLKSNGRIKTSYGKRKRNRNEPKIFCHCFVIALQSLSASFTPVSYLNETTQHLASDGGFFKESP